MNTLLDNTSGARTLDSIVAGAGAADKPFSNGEKLRAELARLGEVLGAFKPYDSQLPVADIAGSRVVTCLYKGVRDSKTGEVIPSKWENAYVRIPTAHISEAKITANLAELMPHFVSYLQGIEDAMIKDSHKAGLSSIYVEGLNLAKLIEKLEETNTGSRLNKEKIEAWFDAELQDLLATKFAAKMDLDENSSEAELAKLEMILAAYKAKFSSLAGGKASLKEADCLAMIAAIKTCELEEDSLGSRFIVRLETMMKKEDEVLFSL